MTRPTHELDLGGLDLTGRTSYNGITFTVMAEGASLGNPEPVDREIASGLSDGSISITERHGNRQPTWQVWAKAADSALLDDAQAMLFTRLSQQPILGWRPPDGSAKRRIYRCHTAHPERIFEGLSEVKRGTTKLYRRYNLRLNADPWAYDPEPTVVEALTAMPDEVVAATMFTGASATGWSSPVGAVAQPTIVSGKLVVAPRQTVEAWQDQVSEATWVLDPTPVDFSAAEYISVDIKPTSARMTWAPVPENFSDAGYISGASPEGMRFAGPDKIAGAVAAYVDGTKLPLKNYVANSDGSLKFTWISTDTSATTVRVIAGTKVDEYGVNGSPEPAAELRGVTLDNITRSNVEPGRSATGRAASLLVEYAGSARTTPSVEIVADTGLGKTLIYTSPVLGRQGYDPACRPYMDLTGLTTEPDAATLSGSRTRVTGSLTTMTWNIPSSRLPQGTYSVVPKLRFIGNSTGPEGGQDRTITTTVSHIVNGVTFFSTVLPVKPVIPALTTTTLPWQLQSLGVAALPPNEIPASDTTTSFVRIQMVAGSFTNWDYEVDQLLLLHQDEGSEVTLVDCGEGAPVIGTVHNYLWLDGPTPLDPKPRLYLGTQPDKSDAFNPGSPTLAAHGDHMLLPGENHLRIYTLGDTYPVVTYSFHKADF